MGDNSGNVAVYRSRTPRVDEGLFLNILLSTSTNNQQRFELNSELGTFDLTAEKSDGRYFFKINTAESDFMLLDQFTQCSISTLSNKRLTRSSVLYGYFGDYEIGESIEHEQLDVKEGCAELQFSFSTERLPTFPDVNYLFAESMMMRLYHDTTGDDVTFICDDVIDSSKNDRQQYSHPVSQPNSNGEASESSDPKQSDVKENGGCLTSDIGNSDHEKTSPSQEDVPVSAISIGARKFVLSQWPYFKTMFSSEFVQGSSGKTEIRIKDVNFSTFQDINMLFFIYSGHVEVGQMDIYQSQGAKNTCCEGHYLAAHRYRIDDLRKQALNKILECLGKADAVAFLFRTGYLFEELRGPVIRHIAKKCHDEVAKKEILEKHKDHPEFCELLSELLEAYYELRK